LESFLSTKTTDRIQQPSSARPFSMRFWHKLSLALCNCSEQFFLLEGRQDQIRLSKDQLRPEALIESRGQAAAFNSFESETSKGAFS
jgi:hypothetical protein